MSIIALMKKMLMFLTREKLTIESPKNIIEEKIKKEPLKKRKDGMVNVLLATGVPVLDEEITKRIEDINFLGSCYFREALESLVENGKPDIIVISELLEGAMPKRDLVLKIRTRYPDVRMVYLLKEKNSEEKRFLYHWMVFDVLESKFMIEELKKAIYYPKTYDDVIGELGPFYEKDEEWRDEDKGGA